MLNTFPVAILVGTVLGFISGLGVGGGSLLILWLTLVLNVEASTARMMNLLFFLPAAVLSCLFRWKKSRLSLKKLLPAVIAGCLSAVAFSHIGQEMDIGRMKKLFGVLLLVTGIRELLYRPENRKQKNS